MYHPKGTIRLTEAMITDLRRSISLSFLLFPLTLLAQVSFELSAVVRPGDAAPVPPQLVQASSPLLNNVGQVAFFADGALFLKSDGTPTIIAAPGDPAVGSGAFTQIRSASMNAQGQMAFSAYDSSPGSGLFLADGKGIRQLVGSGDPAPGGGQFTGFEAVSLNNSGQVAFAASTTSDSQYGIFLFSDGTLAPVALEGEPAPGGGTFTNLHFVSPVLNSAGQITFIASVNPTSSGIFLFADDVLAAIVRRGDSAPAGNRFDLPFALDGSATYNYFNDAWINDQGQIAFAASTLPSGRGGIFLFSDQGVSREVRELDPAPGGGVFTAMFSTRLNAPGQIAFLAATTSGSGLFLRSEGVVTQIVRPPQIAPEGDPFGNVLSPTLNDAGQVGFTGEFANRLSGVYLFSDSAISRVAGPGDPVDRKPTFLYALARAIDLAGDVLVAAISFPGGPGLFNGARVVARAGDTAPGGGVFNLTDYYFGTIIPDQVAFMAPSSRPLISYGVYLASDGVLTPVAISDDPAPGGGTFYSFDSPSLNGNDEIAFAAYVYLPTGPAYGLFVFSGGKLLRLLGSGDPAPGGGDFVRLWYTSFNDAGAVAFSASTSSTGPWGIYLWSQGNVRAIAQSGDPAPGGGTLDFPGNRTFITSLNGLSEVAFEANLSTSNRGVFFYSEGAVSSIARPGDPTPEGETITSADSPSLNDAGQVAFRARISSGFGTYLFSDGTVSRVAAPGDPAPGGGTFTYVAPSGLNASGQVACTGGVPAYGAFLATPVR